MINKKGGQRTYQVIKPSRLSLCITVILKGIHNEAMGQVDLAFPKNFRWRINEISKDIKMAFRSKAYLPGTVVPPAKSISILSFHPPEISQTRENTVNV